MITKVRSGTALLAMERSGGGPPLVCLHAGVADRRMYDAQIPALGDHFDALRYDRRGFGVTETDDEPFSHVADLGTVMEACGVADPILLGCSQGGRVAIDFALAHPGRVRALILISAAVSGAPSEPLPSDIQTLADALEAAEDAGNLARANEIEAHMWLDGPRSKPGRVKGAVRALFLDMNRIALQHAPLTREQAPPPAFARLSELAMPILLILGTYDFPHVVSRHRVMATRFPDARSLACEGNAHLPPLESPERVNEAILKFCRERRLL